MNIRKTNEIVNILLDENMVVLDLGSMDNVINNMFVPFGIPNTDITRIEFFSIFLDGPISPVTSAVIIDKHVILHKSKTTDEMNFLSRMDHKGIMTVLQYAAYDVLENDIMRDKDIFNTYSRGVNCISIGITIDIADPKEKIITAIHCAIPYLKQAQSIGLTVLIRINLNCHDAIISEFVIEAVLETVIDSIQNSGDYGEIEWESVILIIPPIFTVGVKSGNLNPSHVAQNTVRFINEIITINFAGYLINTESLISTETVALMREISKFKTIKSIRGLIGRGTIMSSVLIWKGLTKNVEDAREDFLEKLLAIQSIYEG